MACEKCRALNIPDHLCIEGKVHTIPFNLPEELLYRRFNFPNLDLTDIKLEDVEKLFRLKNDSCNRSSISSVEDTLSDDTGNLFSNWGVWSIPVDILNTKFRCSVQGVEKECRLTPIHEPLDCNYAHTELCFFIGDLKVENNKPKVAKKIFRKRLLDLMRIEKETI